MCILLKLHYAKFDVFRCSKVIEEKPLGVGMIPLGKGRLKPTRIQEKILKNLTYDVAMTSLRKTLEKFGSPCNQTIKLHNFTE